MKIKHSLGYEKDRAASYPPIADQLDALWHAMDRGDIPVAPEFYEMIKQVKTAIPKL